MEVVYQWGANYLVSETEIVPDKIVLQTENQKLKPGDRIFKLGSKTRSEFNLAKGCYMEYEGIAKVGNLDYAIFKCSAWDYVEGKHYRYAFNPVIVDGILTEFMQGSHKGMRDIDVNTIKFLNQ
jgi:hypothetical protein